MAEVEENIYEEVTSKEPDSDVKTEADSNAEAPRSLSNASTVFISCSDASLKDASDVPIDVKMTVGEGRSKSDGAVTEGQKEDITAEATIAALPHSDPFPEPDEDEDEGENAVERLAWDVSTQEVEKKTTNSLPKTGRGEVDDGTIPKRSSVDVAEYDNRSCLKPSRVPKRYTVEIEERNRGKVLKRYAGKIVERDVGIIEDRDRGFTEDRDVGIIEDRDAGRFPEMYPVRAVAKDPADIPERHPGAAEIDPVQALKRYLKNIAEYDPDGLRKRIQDKIADIDNRKNERRYEDRDRDAGEVPRRCSTGFPRTSFGAFAPPRKVPQNGKKNITFGYQPEPMVPPPRRKSRVPPKSKTFSTVSRTNDSITEMFYTFDAEGGEELRVLVDGWPKLEVTRAPGSLLYEGNWTDNPETRIPGEKCKTGSVIEANGCKMRMDRRCDGQEESIALYKDDVLICKAGRKIV